MTLMEIVLDKSYLIGKSGQYISDFCEKNTVLFTEVLFFELLTTTPTERAKCFRKFPDKESPVIMTKNSGVLMRTECLERRPCNLIEDSELNKPFKFHDGMKDPEFTMEEKYLNVLNEWRSSMEREVEEFKKISGLVAVFFPELKKLKAGSHKESVQSTLDKVSGKSQKVLEIYEHIRERTLFPPAHEISNKWLIYRHLQAHLLAAIDYIRKYGSGTIDAQSKKIKQGVMDIEYCILACLANNLASRDTELINMYTLANPEGTVFN